MFNKLKTFREGINSYMNEIKDNGNKMMGVQVYKNTAQPNKEQ